jgi:hypothetical protein
VAGIEYAPSSAGPVGGSFSRADSNLVSTDEELQRDVTRVALRALDGTAFALAGSGAIREHGIIDRPTQDVDLFTSDIDAARFDAAVDSVVDRLRASGNQVDELRRVEQFARLHVTTQEGRFVEIDMGVDYREGVPAKLSIGPVLSLDDAVANKVSALYGRAEARDFIDVDAIRSSGIFTDAQLIDTARERDPGFEVSMFVIQLDRVHQLRDAQVEQYEVQPERLDSIKERIGGWADELRSVTTEQSTSPQLSPELQRIADLHRTSFPTSANEIRTPEHGSSTPGQQTPQQDFGRGHGHER